jgi:DNA-binding transcriptional LysR family regulator
MDSHSLKAFVAVVDCGSFSLAADKLYLTQPAVSKRIASLEQQLDAKLFNRHPKHLTLTESGAVFLKSAREILREFENAQTALQNLQTEIAGTLRVISSHHIGLHRLPMVIKKFLGEYPNVELKIEFMESENAYEKIKRNEADIAFLTLENTSDNDSPGQDAALGLAVHIDWMDPMNIVCALEHPLANLATVNLKTLSGHQAILPEKKTFTYAVLERLFSSQSLSLTGTIPTNYLETIKMLVSSGLGWTVLPNTMIDEFLHVIKVDGVTISRKLGAVSHKNHLLSNSARAFLEVAREIWPD